MWRDVGYVLLLLSIQLLVLLHLTIAPYTKVEESFHIQAIHDIETYGIPTRNISNILRTEYDHFAFPGAVPRTFAGAVALSGLSSPFIWLKEDLDRQFAARAILGLFNALSLLFFANGLRRTAGRTTAIWCLLFQASQFHVIYYASRTLSNMFAFCMTTFSLAALLPEPVSSDRYRKRSRLALYLLTIAGIVFRAELALFLAAHTLLLFATGRIGIQRDIIPAGILGLLLGISTTLSVDSFFWQQFPLWPELAAFKFNVMAGQASAWGTHPWHYYFTNAIPRLLLNPLTYLIGIPMALIQPATRRTTSFILFPSLVYVLLYSAQPHKEWRFIVYVIPPLTAAAALGATYIWTHRTKSFLYRLLSLAMIGSTLASFFISSFILLPASSVNYPGAHALNALHRHAIQTPKSEIGDIPISISVHLGNLACQTGVTRFLQLPSHPHPHHQNTIGDSASWSFHYDKTESLTQKSTPSFWIQFDYVLVEPDEAEKIRYLSPPGHAWEDVETIYGFGGLRVIKPGEEATAGGVEEGLIKRVFGKEDGKTEGSVDLWRQGRDVVRRFVTGGWWVEVKMEEKIRILRRLKS